MPLNPASKTDPIDVFVELEAPLIGVQNFGVRDANGQTTPFVTNATTNPGAYQMTPPGGNWSGSRFVLRIDIVHPDGASGDKIGSIQFSQNGAEVPGGPILLDQHYDGAVSIKGRKDIK